MAEFWSSGENIITPKQKFRFVVVLGPSFFLPNVASITKPSYEVEIKEYKLINHVLKYPGMAKWNPIKITFIDLRGDSWLDKSKGQGESKADLISGKGLKLTMDEVSKAVGNTGLMKKAQQAKKRDPTLDTADLLTQMICGSGYGDPTSKSHALDRGATRIRTISTPEKASSRANAFGAGLSNPLGKKLTDEQNKAHHPGVTIYQMDPEGIIVEKWMLWGCLVQNVSFGDLDYSSDDLVTYEATIAYDYATHEVGDGTEVPPIGTEYQNFSTVYSNTETYPLVKTAKWYHQGSGDEYDEEAAQDAETALSKAEHQLASEQAVQANWEAYGGTDTILSITKTKKEYDESVAKLPNLRAKIKKAQDDKDYKAYQEIEDNKEKIKKWKSKKK